MITKIETGAMPSTTQSGSGNGFLYFLLFAAIAGGIYWFGIKPELDKANKPK